jgi:surface antigen
MNQQTKRRLVKPRLTGVGGHFIRRLRPRWITTIIGIASVFGLVAPASAVTCEIVLKGSDWLGGKGVDVRRAGKCTWDASDPGKVPGERAFGEWQCVNLAYRLYLTLPESPNVGGLGSNGGAKDMWTVLPGRGHVRQAQGSITSLRPGDLIIHNTAGANSADGGYGHVAVVDSINCSTGAVQVVEQNGVTGGRASYSWANGSLSRGGLGPILGVTNWPKNNLPGFCSRPIQPPAQTPSPKPPSTPVPTPATHPRPGVWYEIRNVSSNRCLDARGGHSNNGTAIQQFSCNGTNAQKFQFVPTSDGFYRVLLRGTSSQVLDVTGISGSNGAKTQLWSWVGNSNQQWRLIGGGTQFQFVARHSGKCLDVPGRSSANALQLQQWTCNGTPAQTFQLQVVN